MQTLYQKFDKSQITRLPRVLFEGKIVVVNGLDEAERAVSCLRGFTAIGIDTETRPRFQRGPMHPVALLQASTPGICFLFRLNRIGLPQCLVDLLQDERVCKIGLSLSDDFTQLRHRFADLQPQNIVEIQKLVPRLGIDDMSLQKLYANIMGGFISKGQQLTNWDADSLTPSQQHYAATDAWACLKLYDAITRLLDTHDYELVRTPPQPSPQGEGD